MALSDDQPVILRCELTVSGDLAQSKLPVPRWHWDQADTELRAHFYKSVRSRLADMIVKDIAPRVTETGDGSRVLAASDPLLPGAIRQAEAHRTALELLYRQLHTEGHTYAAVQARDAAEAVDRLVTQLHQDVSDAARESARQHKIERDRKA